MNSLMFSNSEEFKMLKDLVQEFEKNSASAEERWDNISKKFEEWEKSFPGANSSLLSHKMYFLGLLFQEFPSLQNNENERIANFVFPDILTIGEQLTIGQNKTSIGPVRIVRREITHRGGLLLTLEKPDGSRFTYEFLE